MTPFSELGSAIRYRYKSLGSVFLLATCACCWLLTERAAHVSAAVSQPVTPPASTQSAVITGPVPTAAPQLSNSPAAEAVTVSPPAKAPIQDARAGAPARNPVQIKHLQESLWSAMNRRDDIQARLAALPLPAAPVIREPGTITTTSPEVQAATTRVATARSSLAELQTRYTDAYPDVVKAQEELAEAERRLYIARRAVPAPAKPHLVAPPPEDPKVEAERTSLRVELRDLDSSIPDLRQQLDAASALPRRSQPSAAKPAQYWPLVLPAQLQAQLQPSAPPPSSIPAQLQPAPAQAVANPVPSRSFLLRSLFFLPLSIVVGLVCSLAIFILLEALDTTIKGPDSLRHALPADAHQISLGSMRA